ncbi:glycoside hydrolase family 71 protein [Streptomyces sp. TRM76323]|uniref:Glycoside hydrolase family 71 protein n=1 Tax=Streptomyces tamarix TaxID=3078565 RepID=A0ABU3QV95_9ACTN|nr:glycoside hydrolase family 71 protein [Streptomyces tamarix]MDT9686676.1 glycoside hydrolase family 71 protein [Streptomyces tamarix]
MRTEHGGHREARPRHRRHRLRGRSLAGGAVGLLLAVLCAGLAAAWGHDPGTGATPGGAGGPGDSARAGAATALPFDMPDRAALRARGKLVFAHYFTPYPLSLDNEEPDRDYYARHYLTPDGEGGKHRAYGGLLRDRPLPVRPKEGDWESANLRQEVRTARAAGLDGFTLDVLSLSGRNWERCRLLLEAAHAVAPDFKIMLMPDMASLTTESPREIADAIAELGRSPAAHRLDDGRLVVSPFKAEARSAGWWSALLDDLRVRHGVRTAFVPLFLDFGAHHEEYAPISHGFSDWGSRSYTEPADPGRDARLAHRLGKVWMQPVSVQDARPSQGVYDEAGNTATLRATWNRAIEGGADWVQLTTWNDHSEGGHFAPSLHNGHAYLDLSSYHLVRFKTGRWPEITRDTLYLTSRTQFAHAVPTGGQTLLMSLREGSEEARDTVEVLPFLTRPATVRVTVGSSTTTHAAPAGAHPLLVPLRPGGVAAAVVRDGRAGAAVELPYRVVRHPEVQDLQYYAATSGRDTPACCR